MKILNSLQLKNGATTTQSHNGTYTQPIQFISKDKKDIEWAKQNGDWWENLGIQQIKQNGKRLLKNIRLAKGIIDRSDYIPDSEDENSEMIEYLMDKEDSVMELKFFPIIPIVVNILKAEFAKRNSTLMFVGKDDDTYNELLESKRQEIEKYLLSTESKKMQQLLIDQGMDPNSEEFQAQTGEEQLRNLPQIEKFFKKDYQSLIAEWATHQKQADDRRFNMREQETLAFEHSLTCDREFWHFSMRENDYSLELWDPVFSFVFKSPNTEYFSNANVAGNVEFLTPADIIDTDGYLMSEEQLLSLENISGNRYSGIYNITGVQNDGSMYDSTKSYEWNSTGPSLGMRQLTSFKNDFANDNYGIDDLFNQDDSTFDKKNCLRVSTIYWKSQRRLFHLTKITEEGETIQKIVDEDYKITDKPKYNLKVFKEKTAESLISGEHLEPIWNNETWGLKKISRGRGLNRTSSTYDFEPIYLGIDNQVPSRLKFQFKGDDSIYGCKLPVEGRIFSGKNTKSMSPVDLMKPAQINYNLVNNQISDILMDEIGPVVPFDQNMLPKHSLGEDWGPGNYAKANAAMRQFKMLPLDTSTKNMEGTTNFNQMGVLNLDETNRLAGRINLSKHFKEQAMEVIGITPQRVGNVMASETATGTETAKSASYVQTEMLFVQHCDWLMPRVHTMRTDLAQYYHSRNPSLRLQYITSMDEKVNFQMNTTGILSRDVGAFCTTEINSRDVLNKLKQFFVSNNTNGGNMHDLANVLKVESLSEMDRITKAAEEKIQAEQKAQRDSQEKMNQEQIAANAKEQNDQRLWDAEQNRLKLESEERQSMYRSAGMPGTDLQGDGQDDYIQRLNYLQKNEHFTQKLDLDRQKEINKTSNELRQDQIKREDMQNRLTISNKQLEIARVNKNKFDKPAAKK